MAPTPTFASLRMSPEEFSAYKKETKTPLQRSQPTTRTLRVVGYDDGANAAIAASNGNGKEFIEVPWNTSDSVVRVNLLFKGWTSHLVPVATDHGAGRRATKDPTLDLGENTPLY